MIRLPILLALLFSLPSLAHPEEAPDLRGTWKFTAKTYDDWCAFGGQATIFSAPDTITSDYACELTARHYCVLGSDYIVRQVCTIEVEGNEVRVRSTIVEFLKDGDEDTYWPDHFNLTFNPKTGEMIGVLESFGVWKSRWQRSDGGVS